MGENSNANSPPAWDSPTLSLRPPTDDERVTQWSLCAKTWGSTGQIDEFVEAEHRLAMQLGIENGGIRHWILVDTAENIQPGQQRTILSSCENLRRRAVYSYDGNGTRKVEDTTCYGVAAVHCPKEFRGRGYGRRMVTEIGRLLRADIPNFGLEKCLFSVLYSGVGARLYSYGGFEEYPSGHVQISNPTFEIKPLQTPLPTRPIYEDDMAGLCAIDTNLVYSEMRAVADPSKVYVSMLPDVEVFKWHFARERGDLKGIEGGNADVHGAIVGDKEGQRAWIVWMRSYWEEHGVKKGNLLLLRIVVEEGFDKPEAEKKIGSLLCAAMKEAEDWKLPDIIYWNPRPAIVNAAKMWFPEECVEVVKQRTDDLNCFAWYGPSYDSRFGSVQSKDVVWAGSENWCWL